jgi:hypothetical protein
MTMKRFADLPTNDQMVLMLAVFEALIGLRHKSIDEAAAAQEITANDWWRRICADEGFDECEPWPDFPALPPLQRPAGVHDRLASNEISVRLVELLRKIQH